MAFLKSFCVMINGLFIAMLCIITVIYIIRFIRTSRVNSRHVQRDRIIDYRSYASTETQIPVTIIVPVHNKADDVVSCVEELLSLKYEHFEVVVVDELSTDGSRDKLIQRFELVEIEHAVKQVIRTKPIQRVYFNPKYPELLYIEKRRGGIPDAVNCGINASQCPLYTYIQPGMKIDSNAIIKLSISFFKDSATIAAFGSVRVDAAQGKNPRHMTYRQSMGFLECVRKTSFDHTNRDVYESMFSSPGAFGLLNKQLVLECGGYNAGSDCPHFDLMLRLRRHLAENKRQYSVYSANNVVCRVPHYLYKSGVSKTCKRWQRGGIAALSTHIRALFTSRCGMFGILTLPYLWIHNVFSVVCEALAYVTIPLSVTFGWMTPKNAVFLCIYYLFFHIFVSLMSFILEQRTDSHYIVPRLCKKILLYSILYVIFYRQFIIIMRFFGILGYPSYRRVKRRAEKNAKSDIKAF